MRLLAVFLVAAMIAAGLAMHWLADAVDALVSALVLSFPS